MTNPTPRYFDTRSTFTANPRCYVAREWESDESFAKLAFDYHAQFEPVGPVEIYLVDALVLSDHEKRRVTLMQTQVLENRIAADTGHPSAFGLIYIEDQNGPKLLTKLARQLASLQRTWSQSLKLLERYQRQRHDREAQQARTAAEAAKTEAAAKTEEAAKAAPAAAPPETAPAALPPQPVAPPAPALPIVPVAPQPRSDGHVVPNSSNGGNVRNGVDTPPCTPYVPVIDSPHFK